MQTSEPILRELHGGGVEQRFYDEEGKLTEVRKIPPPQFASFRARIRRLPEE